MKIFTIGHSNHPIDRFIAMLRSFGVEVLADIRSQPGSRVHKQYNQAALDRALNNAGIQYIHFPGLGGKRGPRTAGDEVFSGYADYMYSDEFKTALDQLENMAQERVTAYMCAEAAWHKCHRSMVSDHLHGKGWEVEHITDVAKNQPHIYSAVIKPRQGNLFNPNT